MNNLKQHDALVIRKRCWEYAAVPGGGIAPGMRGVLIGAIEAALKLEGDKQADVEMRRYLVFGWLFTPDDAYLQPMQSRELREGQWYALKQWYGSVWTGEQWIPRPAFADEARRIYARAAQDTERTETLILQGNLVDAIFGNLLGGNVPDFPATTVVLKQAAETKPDVVEIDILAELYA